MRLIILVIPKNAPQIAINLGGRGPMDGMDILDRMDGMEAQAQAQAC